MMRPLILAVLAMFPMPAAAWWDYGHETIAAIAWREVTPRTRAKMRALFARQAELATPQCPIRTIAEASVWADCVKPGGRFSYAFPWHFQNVDICKPFDIRANCAFGNCVSAQITRNAALLKDRAVPARERLQALAFLVHFVGDLHQPLHAGDRGDLGGNRAKASYGDYAGSRLNLHAIWDGYLAERAITTPPAGAAGLLSAAAVADRPALAAGTVEDWSRENWQVARDVTYGAHAGDPCAKWAERVALDATKIDAAIPVLRAQILRGGLRLARMLEESLN